MGFFDDLDAEVGAFPIADAIPAGSNRDYSAVIQKLRGGWTFKKKREQPGAATMVDKQLQEVELSFRGRRFRFITRILEVRGRSVPPTVLDEQVRQVDEAGLLDLFVDFPWVGQGALDIVGGDRPLEM